MENNTTTTLPARNLIAAFPGKYIQGENALSELPVLIERLGNKGLIIASTSAKNKILPNYNLTSVNSILVEQFGGECCGKYRDW